MWRLNLWIVNIGMKFCGFNFFGIMYSISKFLLNLNIIYKDFLIFFLILLVLKCVKVNILYFVFKYWD